MEPFWNQTYKDREASSTFGNGQPSSEIVDISSKLNHRASILDIGCGDGRNSLFLSKKGFKIDAFDISEAGIEKIKYLANKENLKINTFLCDMRNFEFEKSYDLIITHGCLHLISKKDWLRLISLIKENTNIKGFNIHAVLTNKMEPSIDIKPFFIGLFLENEIFDFYKDWEVLLKESYIFDDKHRNNISHTHSVNKIVAQKK
jgi:tellurite methyltransferase